MKPAISCLVILVAVAAATRAKVLNPNELKHPVVKGTLQINPSSEENALEIDILGRDGTSRLHGFLGLSHPSAIPAWLEVECPPGDSYNLCIAWGDFASLNIKETEEGACHSLEWTSTFAREIGDCFNLESGVHWYAGDAIWTQVWPIEKYPRDETPYTPKYGIAERYWLLSNGVSLAVDQVTPLFYSSNSTHPNKVCFTARDEHPYTKRSPLTMSYEVCTAPDVRAAHQHAVAKNFDKPSGLPDERMLVQPFWSTWAEYKTEVNQSLVLDYARRVIREGFTGSSHIEIDDDWETCYGSHEFNLDKFPNAREMVDEIKAMGMRITLWVHIFVNYGCPMFNEGLERGYFVKTDKGKTGISDWWRGGNTGLIDVTNPDAVEWWSERLRRLQEETGMDSFKFDGGDSDRLPPASGPFSGDDKLWPGIYTQRFVETCAEFGGLIETRVGYRNQRLPVFTRMNDKNSIWGFENNGLRTLIPTLLQMSLNGYPFVLPDMIGGNNYDGEEITQEFYVRWMQVNSFMPGVQFSLVPWRIGATAAERAETVNLCLEVLALRENFAEHILVAARQSVADGIPMNRPIWWVDPTDSETFSIDDEYMLGDSILVAPVVYQGQTSRDIYLPLGVWAEQGDAERSVTGPIWLRDYPAPINVLPFFVKTG